MESIFLNFSWGLAGAAAITSLFSCLLSAKLERVIGCITGVTVDTSTPGRVAILRARPEWTDAEREQASAKMTLDR